MDVTGKSKGFTLSAVAVACMFAFNAQAATDCSGIEKWQSDKAYTSAVLFSVTRLSTRQTGGQWVMTRKRLPDNTKSGKRWISVIPVTSLHL